MSPFDPVALPDRNRSTLGPRAGLAAALLALSGTVLASAPGTTMQAASAQQAGDGIAALQRENAELRQRIEAIAREIEALRGGGAAPASADVAARLAALEGENQELRRRIDVVADDVEQSTIGDLFAPIQGGEHGLGPAASKVYQRASGLSIGGYGEMLYENAQGKDGADELDALRTVLYLGYKFDEHWLFNSEIEFEHAGEEVGVEFAYLDYQSSDAFNVRMGLVLIPMGWINELHEPTTFLSTHRPSLERFILPSTWREVGAGVYGEAGDFSYRGYVTNGFDASGFSAGGLRGGRQNGSEAIAEDLAVSGRLDYSGVAGFVLGVSAYYGDAGQDGTGTGGDLPSAGTTIYDAHAEYRNGGLQARAVYAHADVDDVAELNNALGLTGTDSVGEELEGWYAEVGYDVLSLLDEGRGSSLTPFVRYETYDTQASVPSGFASSPTTDIDIWTMGLAYQPIGQVVIKLDYQDVEDAADGGTDILSLGVGFIF
ncbi:MAG: porin [Planctomycetota bacterium]|nr:porin [Planctomycetota bacterium]